MHSESVENWGASNLVRSGGEKRLDEIPSGEASGEATMSDQRVACDRSEAENNVVTSSKSQTFFKIRYLICAGAQ